MRYTSLPKSIDHGAEQGEAQICRLSVRNRTKSVTSVLFQLQCKSHKRKTKHLPHSLHKHFPFLLRSRLVDKPCSIVLFALEVLLEDEHFDLILDHRRLRLEHTNALHYVLDEVDVSHSAGIDRALHPLDCLALDNKLSISLRRRVKAILTAITESDILVFLRDQRESDVLRLDVVVEGDCFIHVFK